MEFFPSFSVFVRIGNIEIVWYAITMLTGFFTMYFVAGYDLKIKGYKEDFLDDLFLMCVITGLIGARLWYVLFYPDISVYLNDPLRIFKIWEGGLAIQGAIVGACLYTFFLHKKKKFDFLRILDSAIPVTLIAQAIGRWGNFFNQEAYGPVVSESYFNYYPEFIKQGMFIDGAYRMPMFLLEATFNVVAYILIYTVIKKYWIKKRGDYTYWFLIASGVIRFYIEIFRTDSLMFMGLKSAQLTSLIFIMIGLLGLFGVYNKLFKKVKPILVFDLDGTIVNTRPIIKETYDTLLKKYGKESLTDQQMDELFGPALEIGMKKYFPEIELNEIIKEYRELNKKVMKKKLEPIEGVVETLNNLKQQGYDLAIFSNKDHQAIGATLEICKLTDIFKTYVGIDDVTTAKPNSEGLRLICQNLNRGFDSMVYIGDSVDDVNCGKNIGAYTVAFLESEERLEKLSAAKPNQIIRNYQELEEILKGDHSWTIDMM